MLNEFMWLTRALNLVSLNLKTHSHLKVEENIETKITIHV